MYSIKNGDDLENLNELISLDIQVKAVWLHDKLGKQSFLEDKKKVLEPMTDIVKDVFLKITRQ